MAIHGHLKDDFSRYRKSKTRSIDGSVPGISYNRYRSHLTPSLGSGNGRPAGYHHDLYMHGNPREYRPNINAPSVDWTDYDTYEPSEMHHIPIHNPQPLRGFSHNSSASKLLGIVPEDEQDAGTDIHLPKPTPEDIARRFLDLTDALNCLQEALPKEHPDVLNLRNAISEIINDTASMSELETLAGNNRPSKLGSGNPYEVDIFEQAAKEYDRQIKLFEQSTGQLVQAPHIEQEITPDVLESKHLAGDQTLEDIIVHEDIGLAAEPAFMEGDMINMPESAMDIMQPNGGVIAEEINQAIDQVTEQPTPQEQQPDPFQMQNDPFLMAQQMFDQQMQFMENPFMMPGGFGSMGQMPGPM